LVKQVSIIGCGWLGFPLGIALTQKNIVVKGSTTSKEKVNQLKSYNINPFLIRLTEDGIEGDIDGFLENSDAVIINIPPGLRKYPDKNHVAEIAHLAESIDNNKIKTVIYISSTSVFKNESNIPVITSETEPNNIESAKQLIEIEKILTENYAFKTTIIRFGGLIDEQRHPGKYLSGRTAIKNPNAPINLIHKEDCIEIISQIIDREIFGLKINAVFPSHSTRQLYYSTYAKDNNLPLPQFDNTLKSKGKIIESTKLIELLNYKFKHAI
jgi:nucleoside-diphosphate-sugar epimerase